MKFARALTLASLVAIPLSFGQDFFDRVDQALTFTAFDDYVRARISGAADAEVYQFALPAPALIQSSDTTLFNYRLTLFLDAQIGPKIYAFVQARVDRGFDPSDHGIEARADEYAVRYTPWEDGRFNLQAGRFATIVGNFAPRHLSWDNPFVNAPLPYEQITAIYDEDAPSSPKDFLNRHGADKYEYSPLVWGPVYATGASASARVGKFDAAIELKNAGLSSRPEMWDAMDGGFDHPTVSARVGFRPNEMWTFGISASDGSYFRPAAAATLPPGKHIGDYDHKTLTQDIAFAWHHWQFWAEAFESRYEVPTVGNADVFAYYLEAKYKFATRTFAAARWNEQIFSNVPNGAGGRAKWGGDVWRTDFALGHRFTPHTQLKLQYSLQREEFAAHDFSHIFAAQFTLRF